MDLDSLLFVLTATSRWPVWVWGHFQLGKDDYNFKVSETYVYTIYRNKFLLGPSSLSLLLKLNVSGGIIRLYFPQKFWHSDKICESQPIYFHNRFSPVWEWGLHWRKTRMASTGSFCAQPCYSKRLPDVHTLPSLLSSYPFYLLSNV